MIARKPKRCKRPLGSDQRIRVPKWISGVRKIEFRYGRESNEQNKRIVKISARKQGWQREEGNGRRRKRARSPENIWDGAFTSTCCRCYCCCCCLRLGTGCGFPPESSLFSYLSFSFSVSYPCLGPQHLSLFLPFVRLFFSRLLLAFVRPRWSSLASSVFPPWFADTPPSRLRIGVTKGALSVSVEWGSRLTDSNCIATEWGRDNDTSDARCRRASGPLQNRTTPLRPMYTCRHAFVCGYARTLSPEYAVCVCVKFHEEWCCVRPTPLRIEPLRISLRPFVEVRRSKTDLYTKEYVTTCI